MVATLTEWTLTRRQGTRLRSRDPASRHQASHRLEGQYEDRTGLRVRPQQADRDRRGRRDRACSRCGAARRCSPMKRRDSPIKPTGWSRKAHPRRPKSKMTMMDRAAQKAAGLVTPAREPVQVLLARSDEVDRLNDLARDPIVERLARRAAGNAAASRSQARCLSPSQPRRRARGPGLRSDHRRRDAQQLMTEAASFVQQAIAARKDEKYFDRAFTRISSNSLGYTRLRTCGHRSACARSARQRRLRRRTPIRRHPGRKCRPQSAGRRRR